MNENDVLQLVQRWQDPGTWQTVQNLTRYADELQSQADKLGADARLILDRGDIAQARTLKAESDHLRKCAASDSKLLEDLTGEKHAASVLQQRAEMAGQFMQIESWVREHRPELLEFVPIPKFEGDPSAAIRDLKRLESRIRKPAAETAAGHPGQPKIIPIVDPEIQAVFEAVQKSDPETLNLIEICREVERTQGGCKAESIRRKWNRFKRKHG